MEEALNISNLELDLLGQTNIFKNRKEKVGKKDKQVVELGENEQDRKIEETFRQEKGRLRSFIRNRVSSDMEAEDILQDVFYQLVQTYRIMKPVEQVSSWLFTVARNKITDMFRKKKPDLIAPVKEQGDEEEGTLSLFDVLVTPEPGPEGEMIQNAVMEELEAALAELPKDQSYVFVQHEIEGRSFKELSEETGVTVNTLISRKRYAIMFLRERLETVYREFIFD